MNTHASDQRNSHTTHTYPWLKRGLLLCGLVFAFLIIQSTVSVPAVLAAALPSSIGFEQWETIPAGAWINGNLGNTNSNYAEGDTVPQRVVLTSVPNGIYDLVICRDFSDGTRRGYLYLDPFDTTVAANPGGTITSTSLDGDFDGVNTTIGTVTETGLQGTCGAGQLQTIVNINISKPVGGVAYVLWGGHLAAPGDTDPVSLTTVALGNGASSWPGSSLHMHADPNKDNQINTNALTPLAAPLITVSKVDNNGQPLNGWCFAISGTSSASQCASNLSNSVTFSNLAVGPYTVVEVVKPGWQFVSVGGTRCTQAGINNASVTLSNAEPTATCTFVNLATPLSVYLSDLKVSARANGAKIKWTTANEMPVTGFNVWRSRTRGGAYVKLNAAPLAALHLGELIGDNYVYRDRTVKPGKTYFYKIEVLGGNGTLEWSDVKRLRVP